MTTRLIEDCFALERYGETVIVAGVAHIGRADPIPGAARYKCDFCGQMAWISPSGQALLDKAFVMCTSCYDRIDVRPARIRMGDGALKELGQHTGRRLTEAEWIAQARALQVQRKMEPYMVPGPTRFH